MDVIQAIQDYITKMVESVAGMKVLIMDKETVRAFRFQLNSSIKILTHLNRPAS